MCPLAILSHPIFSALLQSIHDHGYFRGEGSYCFAPGTKSFIALPVVLLVTVQLIHPFRALAKPACSQARSTAFSLIPRQPQSLSSKPSKRSKYSDSIPFYPRLSHPTNPQ